MLDLRYNVGLVSEKPEIIDILVIKMGSIPLRATRSTGKEDDGEWNMQDYGMRVYDPRLCRFPSVDPLTKKYPYYTPYQFSGNCPIKFVDLDGMEPAESQNPKLKGNEARMYAPNIAYAATGGDNLFIKGPAGNVPNVGHFTKVDKTKFIDNKKSDDYGRYVNETSQFLVTDEKAFVNETGLVNYLLGSFLWGLGPENYVFPENGIFSSTLKNSIAVKGVLNQWAQSNGKPDLYHWGMGLTGELQVDQNTGLTSLEHFLGSVSVKISNVDADHIRLEIFNITSITSGDLDKDIPPKFPALNSLARTESGKQLDHTNISQYFSFTLSVSEAKKLMGQDKKQETSKKK